MKLLSLTLTLTLILGGLILAGTTGENEQPPSQPANINELPLIPSEQIWFYGHVPKDAWVGHHFRLYNPHEDTVTITKLIPGCDCTHVPSAPISIAPGESYLLKSQFDTRTYAGEINRDIRILTDYKPAPEMYLYFISLVASQPRTLTITPVSTMFIQGKESQLFIIKNLVDKKTHVTVLVDNDSILTVSRREFDIGDKGEYQIEVKPVWDNIEPGQTYSCLVLDIARGEEVFRAAIPVKLTRF